MRSEPVRSQLPVRSHLAIAALCVLIGFGCTSTGSNKVASASDFCVLLQLFNSSNVDLDQTFATKDATAIKAGIQRLGRQLATMQASAPQELRADISGMTEFVATLNDLLGKVDYDIAKLDADPTAVEDFAALPQDQFVASRELLSTYDDTTCVRLRSGATTIAG